MINRQLAEAFEAFGARAALYSQDGQSVTFARLSELVSRLHGHLTRAGVMPGDRVAINIDNPTLAVCLRLALMRSGADILLTPGGPGLAAGLQVDHEVGYAGQPGSDPALHLLGFTQDWLDTPSGREPDGQPAGDVILATSGSSGRAKYVAISADNLAARDARFETLMGPPLGAHLVTMPVATSVASRYLIRCLIAGHGFMGQQGAPRTTLVWAKEFGVAELVTTPLVLERFVDAIEQGGPNPRFARTTVGGAGASRDLLIRAGAAFGGDVFVAVGASENGTYGLGRFDRAHFATGWTGRVPDWVETRLDDPGQFPAHHPNAGRLALRIPPEDRVRGYLGGDRPVHDAEGWFATGDIATINDARELRLLGRADFVLNFSGDKYAPELIEALLAHSFDMGAVAVTKLPGNRTADEAMGIALTGAAYDADAVLALLRARMNLAVPVRFQRVAGLPVLPGGKLNRRALPALFG